MSDKSEEYLRQIAEAKAREHKALGESYAWTVAVTKWAAVAVVAGCVFLVVVSALNVWIARGWLVGTIVGLVWAWRAWVPKQ